MFVAVLSWSAYNPPPAIRIRKDMRRFLSLLMTLCLPLTAFAGNIKDTDLITSNTLIAGMGGCRLEI